MNSAGESILVVDGGPKDGESMPLTEPTVTLGRALDNDVVVPDKGVSRRHAALVWADAGYCVKDLSSTNGTFLNGVRLDKTDHLLKDSDSIRLGEGTFSYVFHSPTAETIQLRLEPATEVKVPVADQIESSEQHQNGAQDDEATRPTHDGDVYEGTVRLNVRSDGNVGLMVGFVQRLGDSEDCRLLRLLGDATDGVEAWVKLWEPTPLREWLADLEGVNEVSPTRDRDLSPDGQDNPLTVRLKASDSELESEE